MYTDSFSKRISRHAPNLGLDREFRLLDGTYGADHLDLVLAKGYLARLIENPRVAKYLRDHHRDIALEFIRIVEQQATAV